MREVCAIEPKWLTEVAPSFFKVANQNTISRRKKSEKIGKFRLSGTCCECAPSSRARARAPDVQVNLHFIPSASL